MSTGHDHGEELGSKASAQSSCLLSYRYSGSYYPLPNTYNNPSCQLCGTEGQRVPETILHSLGTCEGNKGLPARLLALLQLHHDGTTLPQVLTLHIPIDPSAELALVWLISSTLLSIWKQRREGRVIAARTRAELEASCRLLREGKVIEISNAYTQVNTMIQSMFSAHI